VDDNADPLFAPRQIVFQIVFFVWATLNEQKWVTLAERRGYSRKALPTGRRAAAFTSLQAVLQ